MKRRRAGLEGSVDDVFAKATRAGRASTAAALRDECGEALDNLMVAASAQSGAMHTRKPGEYYDERRYRWEEPANDAWIALKTAENALREHCLINLRGRGLEGSSRKGRRR